MQETAGLYVKAAEYLPPLEMFKQRISSYESEQRAGSYGSAMPCPVYQYCSTRALYAESGPDVAASKKSKCDDPCLCVATMSSASICGHQCFYVRSLICAAGCDQRDVHRESARRAARVACDQ
eukprot:989767-Rhodomonas_salina.4